MSQETSGGVRWRHSELDEIPCTKCGLRGHLAGDPDRCLVRDPRMGMGQSPWMGGDGGL